MKFDPTSKALSYGAWSGAGGAFFLGRPVVAGVVLVVHAALCGIYWVIDRG